jgi:hypothetical protein
MLPISLDCFCFAGPHLVYPMLPVSLDCPFLIVPSVFLNVYLKQFDMIVFIGRDFNIDSLLCGHSFHRIF